MKHSRNNIHFFPGVLELQQVLLQQLAGMLLLLTFKNVLAFQEFHSTDRLRKKSPPHFHRAFCLSSETVKTSSVLLYEKKEAPGITGKEE